MNAQMHKQNHQHLKINLAKKFNAKTKNYISLQSTETSKIELTFNHMRAFTFQL